MPSLVEGTNNIVADKTFEDLLDTEFTIQSKTLTSDSMGGFTEAWTDGATFDGRISIVVMGDRFSTEKIENDKPTVLISHKIYCKADVVIDEEDRVKLGSRYFEVKMVKKPSNLETGHLEISVLEVD